MRCSASLWFGFCVALFVGFGCEDSGPSDAGGRARQGQAGAPSAGAATVGGSGAGASRAGTGGGGDDAGGPPASDAGAGGVEPTGADAAQRHLHAGADAGAPRGTPFEGLVTGYTELERLTEQPIEFVDLGLCRIPIRGFDTPVHTVTAELDVYANAPAVAPFAETGERTFPVGSIIVKEKRADDAVVGLGMMLKSESGWTYAYHEDGQLYEDVPELALCGQCHDSGEVPAELADAIGLDTVREPIELPTPRDSVFLTLPESDAAASGW